MVAMLARFYLFYLLLALVYLVSLSRRPYRFSYLIKALPVLLLLAPVWMASEGTTRLLLIGALLFSAAGDIALDVDRGRHFVAGLVLFLVAHVWYVVHFARDAALRPVTLPAMAVIVAVALVLARWLWPHLGSLRTPVLLYITVITAMAATATAGVPLRPLVVAGALSFMLSDALIAVHKFVRPVPARDYLIMGTYYGAQLLIIAGSLI